METFQVCWGFSPFSQNKHIWSACSPWICLHIQASKSEKRRGVPGGWEAKQIAIRASRWGHGNNCWNDWRAVESCNPLCPGGTSILLENIREWKVVLFENGKIEEVQFYAWNEETGAAAAVFRELVPDPTRPFFFDNAGRHIMRVQPNR